MSHRFSRFASTLVSLAALPGLAFAGSPATHFSVSIPDPVPFYTATPATITALGVGEVVDTTYNGTIVLSSSDPGFVNLGPAPAVNGVLTINFAMKTAGVQSLTATDQTNASLTGTTSATVLPGPVVRLTVVAPSSVSQGVPFNFTVSANDLYGNVVPGYTGTVHFTSSSAGTLPADSTLSNGSGTFSATLTTLPSATISATDTGNPDINGTSSGILTPVTLQDYSVD